MIHQKQRYFSLFTMAILLSFVIIPGYFPQFLIASPRLPNVTPEMERPQFWTKKIKNPTNLLLTPDQIQKMNEENLKRQDFLLCRVKDLKENWGERGNPFSSQGGLGKFWKNGRGSIWQKQNPSWRIFLE